MGEKLYVIFFTVVVTAVFVGAAAALNAALADTTARNRELAKQRVILNLFGFSEEGEGIPGDEVDKLFKEKVSPVRLTTSDNEGIASQYTYYKTTGADSSTLVIPIAGMGFWDKMIGYLAVDMNTQEIQGVDFTEQAETPGLGGRIADKEIRDRFIGKRIDKLREDGVRIRVRKNPTDPQTDVEAITGATETSKAVQKLLNHSIDRFFELVKTKEGAE